MDQARESDLDLQGGHKIKFKPGFANKLNKEKRGNPAISSNVQRTRTITFSSRRKQNQPLGLENTDLAMLKGITMSTVNNINPSLCLLNTENSCKAPTKLNTMDNQMNKSSKKNTITIGQVSYAIPEKVQQSIKRYKRQRKDITYDSSVNFDGVQLPINNSQENGAYRTILRSIHTQISKMLANNSKVFTLRFDLHFNSDDFDEAIISKFFKIIKQKYSKTGQIMHVWVREIDSSNTPHYHCVLGFNGNKIQSPIKVFNSIVTIWNGKLKQPRPHLCNEGNHMISNTHDNIFKDAFKRLSYLAKIKTKDRQPPNKKNFSASQIKLISRINKVG